MSSLLASLPPWLRRLLAALAIGSAAIVLTIGARELGWFEEIEWKSFDVRVRLTERDTAPPKEVALILIDEASLRMMNPLVGRWPWPRSVHADVVDFLAAAGARRVVFDILFTENERGANDQAGALGENDARFAAAVAGAGNVVSAVQIIRDEPDEFNRTLLNRPLPNDFVEHFALRGSPPSPLDVPAGNNAYLPFPELYEGSRGIGVVEFSPDRDGIYRRTRLLRWYDRAAFPVLSLAALGDHFVPIPRSEEQTSLPLRATDGSEVKIPLQADGNFLIKPYRTFHAYSMSGVLASIHKIMQGETTGLPVNPDEFRNKVVFIGASAVGVEDLKPTSFGELQPGVFLHASIVGNVLHGDYWHQAPRWIDTMLTVILTLTMAIGVLLPTRSVWRTIIPLFLIVGGVFAAVSAFGQNMVVETVAPLSGMGLAWLGSFAWLSSTEGKDKRRIRRMLGQYVSPAVLESVVDRAVGGELKAEVGAREHLTILFSDIRGFTNLSEALEPEQVVEILNGYFTGMVDIIFHHQGTLDKFIGDAIMAFWGAPLRIDDHAVQGVRTAVEMSRWLDVYNETLRARGMAPLAIGIGLHSGPVILGNIGSVKKLDYTIIGDNVNLSSRLEGLTKQYGCSVLISETTREEAGSAVICRPLDNVRVKGKSQPIRIYEALALATDEADRRERAEELARLTESAFSCYLARDWRGAVATYRKLYELRPDDHLATLFIERCEHYLSEEPPADWDGVFTMKTK